MKYSNPHIPEGINYKQEHPAKEFFILTAGILGIIAVLIIALHLLASYLAHHIPYVYEKKFAGLFETYFTKHYTFNDEDTKTQTYLQTLAERLAQCQSLPDDMRVKVHYVNDDTVNALATLGGNIVIYRGLLASTPNENTLAFVLSHEIAHVQSRHPIRALSSGILIGLTLGLLDHALGSGLTGDMLNTANLITQLKFSRHQELAADRIALETLVKCYGNGTGAQTFFTSLSLLQKNKSNLLAADFISTHPNHDKRIEAIQHNLRLNNWTSSDGHSVPLPDFIAHTPTPMHK